MRWTTLYAFALASLAGCYSPDYSSKPCSNNDGCPTNYFCDTARPSGTTPGTCSLGSGTPGGSDGGGSSDMMQGDMGPAIQPPVLTEYVVSGNLFYLGSNLMDLAGTNDSPAYQRAMGSICAAEKEVTVANYTLCVQAGRCTPPAGNIAGCNYGIAGREQHPINCVEFPQAQAFCAWINRRLPTESEWEYVANGGTMNTAEKYPWAGMGGTFDALKACFNNGGTCPVGTKTRTYAGAIATVGMPGFYDLGGNVWEWTTSEFCPYLSTMQDRQCASPGRVVRGGSGYDIDGRLLRSTVRLGNAKDSASIGGSFPNSWVTNLGFRCFGDVNGMGACGP